MPIPLTDLQGINPTSIIELFQLELDVVIHGNQALGWTQWAASTDFKIGAERKASTTQSSGLVFQVTVAGRTGSSEPTWPTAIDGTVVDGGVTWKAVNPTYYFHNGASGNEASELRFGGRAYQRMPIQAEGFEYKGGKTVSLPRPSITISNLFSSITAILNEVNETTQGNDLTGAKLTRIRTLAKYVDYENYGTQGYLSGADDGQILMENEDTFQLEELGDPSSPDDTQQFPQEIYYVDRKVQETRDIVEFELASIFDLAGVRVPKRQCLPAEFPGIGTFY